LRYRHANEEPSFVHELKLRVVDDHRKENSKALRATPPNIDFTETLAGGVGVAVAVSIAVAVVSFVVIYWH
jgi:hypothetical protein